MQEYGVNPFGESLAAPPPPPVAPVETKLKFELRPLSLGEILDRTFAVYRQRFWLFVGISAIAATVPTLSTFVQLMFGLQTNARRVQPDMAAKQLALTLGIALVASAIYLVVYSLTQAATVSAVTAVYLGDEMSIKKAFGGVWKRWLRYVLIALWQLWSAVWVPVLAVALATAAAFLPMLRWLSVILFVAAFAGIVYGVIAAIRNSLGIVSAAVEDLKVRQAMRRSKVLVAGHKGRVFGLFLLVMVLQIASGTAQGIVGIFLGLSSGAAKVLLEAGALLLTFTTTSLVTPVAAISLCLFYIDERVRKEGFDIELLMARTGPPAPPRPDELPSPFSSELV